MNHTVETKKKLIASIRVALRESSEAKLSAKEAKSVALDVAIQGAEYYLTRATSLRDFVAGLVGWVRDDSPEFAKVLQLALSRFQMRATAAGYVWDSLKEGKWYKALMINPLGAFEKDEKVWVKINTEASLSLGKTLWIYGPKTERIMHVIFDAAPDFCRVYLEKGRSVPAEPREQKILDKAWGPVVDDVLRGWAVQRRKAKKMGLTKP